MNSYFFIDGFNIYHAIKKSFKHQKYKWLDLKEYCKQFVGEDEVVKEVLFFTAYTIWDDSKIERHKTLVRTLSHKGVTVVKGRFKKVSRNFSKKMDIVFPEDYVFDGPDKIIFQTYEEKETDVNIAIKMFEYAMNKNCQKMYLMSEDSDLIPVVKAIRRNFPDVKIINVLPIFCKPSMLGSMCDEVIQTDEEHLKDFVFDEEIKIDENTSIRRPSDWV